MENRLLILGSLPEFEQLILKAKARGLYTVVADGYPNTKGKALADAAYDIHPGDTAALAEMCKKERINGVITSFSDYLFECMVKLADAAGLKCYCTPDKLDLYRNKSAMKSVLDSLGIATSRFKTLDADFADEELQDFHFPVVVKPLDMYGSRGVLVLRSIEEIREHFSFTCETSSIKKLLVEEYNDGWEFNLQTWVVDGQVKVLGLADREKTPTGVSPMDIPNSTRNIYPSRLLDDVLEEAVQVLQTFIGYTGQTAGALSMQFFWKPGQPVSVCEIAGRLFGYEHNAIEYASGLAVEDVMLDYVYDENTLKARMEAHDPRFPKTCAVLYFHGKPNRIVIDQSAGAALAKEDGVEQYWPFYETGEVVETHGKNPYAALYYVTKPDRESMDTLTQKFFEEFKILDKNGENILYPNRMPEYPDNPENPES